MSKDVLEELISREYTNAPSDKLFNGLAFLFCVLSGVMILGGFLSFAVSERTSAWYWTICIFPIVITSILSTLFAIRQLIRRLFLSSMLILTINIVLFVTTIIVIIATSNIRGGFFPFYFL
ncbi:MAG: hypothetical protein FWC80_00610 [Firmicutes bacterium]|nr:hypothetical protein [Bacillota bacterium]